MNADRQGEDQPFTAALGDEQHTETPPDSTGARFEPLKVLAVDDDALVLLNIAAMLEDEGHQVTMAYSGKEALKALRGGEPFDLLITDQAMRGMTGVELIEIVRAERPGLPVVLATGYAALPPGLAADVSLLTKPFLQEQLLQAVGDAVKAKPGR